MNHNLNKEEKDFLDSYENDEWVLFCLHLRYRSDSDKTTGPTAIAD
jgi:hypothetical protein